MQSNCWSKLAFFLAPLKWNKLSESTKKCNYINTFKHNFKKLYLVQLTKGRGGRGGRYGVTKCRNTDYFCLKIPLYHRMFSKTLRPNFFTPSQVFMYLKATRPKFFQDSTIDKIHVLYITLHIISNMYFKGIKSVTLIHR